jgi:phage tail-like protein
MRRAEIERLLPDVFQRTLAPESLLAALLDVMADQHEPAEAALERLDATFDPRRTADRFVPFLAYWVDLGRLSEPGAGGAMPPTSGPQITTGLGRLRELVAVGAYLSQWRGTAKGLRLFLETATGIGGFELQEASFHLRVTAPEAARPHRALIERIVESEKPAYVTYELHFGPSGQGGA